MHKSIRSFVLVATLAIVTAPVARANQTGCNPHPQAVPVSTGNIVIYTVLSLFGH